MPKFSIQSKHANGGGWQTVHEKMTHREFCQYWRDFAWTGKASVYRAVAHTSKGEDIVLHSRPRLVIIPGGKATRLQLIAEPIDKPAECVKL
jgi:hypothetical protein